jgi:hypothetical protein
MPGDELSTTIEEEEEEVNEEEELPSWVLSVREQWWTFKSAVANAWRRRGAVRLFLKAVKSVSGHACNR